MPQNGEINLSEVKARYSVDDVVFVDIRELNSANDARLYYEISLAIGLTILGAVVTEFSWELCLTSAVFLVFGLFNLIKYLKKCRQMTTTKKESSRPE